MASLIVYYAHPAQRHSHVNRAMADKARELSDITFVDLYAEYPRHNIDVDAEQARLVAHDIILFQFPLFWYSTPSLIKEWLDLVLEYGFAYGSNGDKLSGKTLMLAVSIGGDQEAYTRDGTHRSTLKTFLSPLEQTARLCQMQYTSPFVLFGSLHARETNMIMPHADAYGRLLSALRDDVYDFQLASQQELVLFDSLPIVQTSAP